MDYLELISKFDNNHNIPYEELLNTSEWKELRTQIIQRDKSCCTNCGKTKSFYHLNFNISIQTRDRLRYNKIIYLNKSLDRFKKEMGIENINILKLKVSNSVNCGIAESGQLFLINWDHIKEAAKSDLVINSGLSEFGNKYFIIGKVGYQIPVNTFSIPILSDKQIMLHVHHKFYIKEKLPWEYEKDALITLCNWCHWELHKQTNIPIFTMVNGKLIELEYTPCKRCHGAGVFPEYKNVQSGICFRCNGSRYEELIPTDSL